MSFMDNITPLTLFLVLLLGVAFVLLMWLKYLGNTHRFYGVYDIVRSWCAILSVLLLAFSLGEFALMALGVFMCLQGLKEWHNVSKNPYQKITRYDCEQMFIKPLMAMLIVVFAVSFMYLSHVLANDNQLSILFWLMFTAQINDVFQYLMGKSLGHRFFKSKLAPNISPNKTIEGVIFGALITSLVSVVVAKFLTPYKSGAIFLLALMICSLGVLGDLTESLFKRCHGVKDTANWLKGHGGLLDRIDSLLFSFPVFAVIYFGLS